MTWVRVVSADGLGEQQTTSLDGGTWAAATTPLAIAAVAAVAALFAIRGRWTLLLAGLVALVAVAAAVPAAALLFS
ncbi:MAG: Trp biosynthesis-associated membrane protein, partial [Rhodococcus sp. (in: high G+C Gram-positive bacteria)]